VIDGSQVSRRILTTKPSQIIIHVRMLDVEASVQQEALGIVGVNLLYGRFLFASRARPNWWKACWTNSPTGRIEIDLIDFKGIEFRYVGQSRLMKPEARPARPERRGDVWPGSGGSAAVSEILYKKAILVERGSFRPVPRTSMWT